MGSDVCCQQGISEIKLGAKNAEGFIAFKAIYSRRLRIPHMVPQRLASDTMYEELKRRGVFVVRIVLSGLRASRQQKLFSFQSRGDLAPHCFNAWGAGNFLAVDEECRRALHLEVVLRLIGKCLEVV